MALQIRYSKTHFTLTMMHDTILSTNKVSALRGGIGTMLLNSNCIQNRQCGKCSFIDECLVQRIMYSKFDVKPNYITTGESVGYVFECYDKKRHFRKGDTLEFNLILFGKSIIHFSQYIQAIFSLGQSGLGSHHSHFLISRIQNEYGKDILQNGNIIMKNYLYQTVEDYVQEKLEGLSNYDYSTITLQFLSPTSIKYKGKFITQFDIDPIMQSIVRRIEILNYYENNPISGKDLITSMPNIINEHSFVTEVNRYSSTHNGNIRLQGIIGNITLSDIDENSLIILLAGELLHIGKNSSFGFGKYTVEL